MKRDIFSGIHLHYIILLRIIYSWSIEYTNISVDWLNTRARNWLVAQEKIKSKIVLTCKIKDQVTRLKSLWSIGFSWNKVPLPPLIPKYRNMSLLSRISREKDFSCPVDYECQYTFPDSCCLMSYYLLDGSNKISFPFH